MLIMILIQQPLHVLLLLLAQVLVRIGRINGIFAPSPPVARPSCSPVTTACASRCTPHDNARRPKHSRSNMLPRAGIEGTHAQGMRRCGLRQSRYIGLARTHLQHIATAAALNVVRMGEWLAGTPHAKTRCSPFAALKAA
jgi:DDE family transposase